MENIFKDRLKELRQEKEIGHRDLAKIINVSSGAISLWENGLREPTMTNLITLARYFGVTIDYLVGLED